MYSCVVFATYTAYANVCVTLECEVQRNGSFTMWNIYKCFKLGVKVNNTSVCTNDQVCEVK